MDAQRQTRSCDRERVQVEKGKTSGGVRQICVPLTRQQYGDFWGDAVKVREYLDPLIVASPEIFPGSVVEGYQLHGRLPESKKLPGVRLRQLRTADGTFTLRPSFVLAYMTGTVEELEKPLLLLAVNTPIWVVTAVFGRNDMFWERLLERLGRNSLVGTTVRVAERMPEHLAADEHHLDWRHDKGFLAMVAANGCILGAALSSAADEPHLQEAYGVFAEEARDVVPDWQPKTVSTDGWKATRAAFSQLFGQVVLVLCFLHGFLKIRDRSRQQHDLHQRVWEVYRADTAAEFHTRMTALKTWSDTAELRQPVRDNLAKLFAHEADYAVSYDHPNCYRTSNQVDRPMNRLRRSLYASRGLHGHQATSERRLRGQCLLNNFRPFAPRSNIHREHHSPAHRLNNRRYHDNWLHNLQVSASMQGFHHRT